MCATEPVKYVPGAERTGVICNFRNGTWPSLDATRSQWKVSDGP